MKPVSEQHRRECRVVWLAARAEMQKWLGMCDLVAGHRRYGVSANHGVKSMRETMRRVAAARLTGAAL